MTTTAVFDNEMPTRCQQVEWISGFLGQDFYPIALPILFYDRGAARPVGKNWLVATGRAGLRH